MNTRTLVLVLLTTPLALLARPALAQSTDVLNPFTVASPSGQTRLTVQPSQVRGVGPCTLTVTQDGTQLWQRELDTTAWHAAVTDEGRALAVTYTYGGSGSSYFGEDESTSAMHVVVLDPDGNDLSRETVPRAIRFIHGSGSPAARHVLTIPRLDLGIVETSGPGNLSENWLRFRLSTGERLGAVFPDHADRADAGSRNSITTEPIPGTPLVLKVWDRNYWGEDQPHIEGTRLAVLNRSGTAVWSRLFEGEQDTEHENAPYRSFRELQHRQAGVSDRSFTFRSLVLDQTLTFECEQIENGDWAVIEKAAEPGCGLLDDPAITGIEPPKPVEQLATLDLDVIETVQLIKDQGPPPVIDGVSDFQFDPAGRIGFVGKGDTGYELRLINTAGELLQAVPLGFAEQDRTPEIAPRRDGTWLIGLPEYQPGRVWELDPTTGESRLIREWAEDQSINALVALPDGGFIASITDRSNSGWENSITRIESKGNTVWSNDELEADNLVLMPDGTVATLNDGNDIIKVLSLDGEHLEDIVLEEKFGPTTYPCGLNTDGRGGLWVFFQDRNHQFYHLGADRSVLPMISPKLKNGQRFGSSRGVRTAPDGSTWASDGRRIMRLGENDTADVTLGDDPDNAPPRAFGPIAVAQDGTLFALNRATGVVHVLDPQGNELDQRRGPPEYKYNRARGLAIGHDGTIVFNFGMGGSTLRIGPDGEFLGVFDSYMDETTESYFPNPDNAGGWAVGYRSVAVISPDGQIAKHIHKRPDGEWLESPKGFAIAPDGAVAVSAGPAMQRNDPHSDGSPAICLYTADGEPVATVPAVGLRYASSSKMAYDPPWVVVSDQSLLHVYDTRPNDRGEFPSPRAIPMPQIEGQQDAWFVFRSVTPGEVLATRIGSTELLRIRLPED